MKEPLQPTPSSGFRVFNASLLSFLLIMMPFVQVAAATRQRSAVRDQRSEPGRKATEGANSAADLFVNPPAMPAVGITATKTDAYTAHPGPAAPGDTITYTVDVSNPNPPGNDATGVTFEDIIDANTTRFGTDFDLKVSPLAINDTYSVATSGTLNTPAPGVLTNDTGLPAPTVTAVDGSGANVGNPIPVGGGTLTLNADGSFTYNAPAAQGPVSFTYTIGNGQTPPNPGVDNQATVTINVDAAPEVSSTTPVDNAINQAGNTDISISFSEAVNVTGSWFTISCTSSGLRNVSDTVVTPNGSNTVFTINPNTDFTESEICTVTVFAAQVTDQDSNDPPDTMAADHVFDFTMDAAPTFISSNPVNGLTGVATSTNIAITFSESVTASTSSFTISCPAPGNLQTYTVSGSGTATITLVPSSNLPVGTLCSVQIIGTQIFDTDTNDPPNTMTSSPVFAFTTDAAPTVSSSTPAQGATIVATSADITLNFSESVDIAAGGITLNCGAGNLAFTPALPQNGVSSIVINPAANLPPNTLCTVTGVSTLITDADAGDPPNQLDGDSNGSEGPNFVLTFTTDAAPRVTSTTPLQGATQVGASTNITLNFSEAVDIAAGGITLNCGAGDLTFTPVLPQNGVTSIVINPDADLPFGTLCTVTGVAANIYDVDSGDPPNQLDGNGDGTEGDNFTLTFTIDAVPTVISTTPANTTLSNAKLTNITINFSENVGVTAGGVTISCGAGNLGFSGLPATNVNQIVLDPTNPLPAGSTCTVTVLSANTTDADAGDPPNNLDGDNNGSEGGDYVFTFGVAPDAVDDIDNATGNIGLVIPANGVLANDVGPGAVVDRVGPTTANNVVPNGGSFTSATSAGGSVTMNSDGGFTYVPLAGQASGTDTFKYRISNAGGSSADATVTITITGIVWFICDGCVSSNAGTLANPYTSINSFSTNNTGAANKPSDNQRIYIRSGTYDASNDNLTLRAGQIVSGQGQAATTFFTPESPAPSTYAALTAGTRPIIAPTSGNAVTVNNGNIISHFDIGNGSSSTSAALLTGPTTGNWSLTAGNMIINGRGRALDLSTAVGSAVTLTATFDTVSTSNSTLTGITLTRVNGTLTMNGGAISGVTGDDVFMNAGTATVLYTGTITNTAARSVNISNRTGGSVTFNGAVSDTGTGILLDNNDGSTITFRNGLSASTGANTAFSAINGGTVAVCDENPCVPGATGLLVNTLTTTTGTALNVNGTTIGSDKLEFKSISASGGPNGIILNNSSGNLTVNGDGTGLANGSGGTISNITGGVLGNAPVYTLTHSGTVILKSMHMSLNTNAFSGMLVDNNAGGTIVVNITGCTFTGVTASVVQNKSLLQFEAGGTANLTANVQNSFFNGSRTYGMFATGAGTSVVNVTLNQSGFGTNVNAGAAVNQPGTSLTNPPAIGMAITNSSSALVDYTVTNNTFWGADGIAGGPYAVTFSGATTTAGSHLEGFFNGNKIGKTGTTGSGCSNGCAGLGLLPGTQGTFNASVSSNDIRQVNAQGINFFNSVSGSSGTSIGHFTNNTITEPDTTGAPLFQRGLAVSSGNSGGSTANWCAEITGNNISGAWQAGNLVRITTLNTTGILTIPGLTPLAGATGPQVDTYIEGANTIGAGNSNTTVGGAINGSASPCAVPLLLAEGGVDAISFLSALTDLATNASGDRHNAGTVSSLNQAQLDAIVAAATQRWTATGLTQQQMAAMRELRFRIGDLADAYLGKASGNRIVVDQDAQGKGWFIDTTPADDVEFGTKSSATRSYTNPYTSAAGRIDLLTAIEHEIGHKLGLGDSYADADRDSIMYGYLTMGERRVPARGQAANAQAGSLAGTHFLKIDKEVRKKAEVSGQKSAVRSNKASKALAPVSGETLTHVVGTLPAGKKVRITFKVTINAGFGGTQVSNQGTVTGAVGGAFTVQTDDSDTVAANDATVTQVVGLTTANDDAYNAFKDTPLNVPAPGVRANDSNVTAVTGVGGCPDVVPPAFSGCATTGGGTVTVNDDGSFSYVPLLGFTGPDTFTYSVTGGTGTDTATVTITVADTSAIYINEVLFHPDGTGTSEYIELRGPISGLIPAGTYLVVVDGDAGTTAGDVTTIINLSGLSFGTNGFLVLLQNGNTYTTAAGATVITSTTTGFGSLAGAPWQADSGTSLENSGATFMLIQTGTAPSLSDDIDTVGDDGTPDGSVYAGWSVRDSVGHLTGANANDRAYGAINYITGGSGTGSGTVVTPSFISVYVGRICDSTGSTAADWVASDGLSGTAPNWKLGSNTSPASFAGNPLDHIGTTNFINNAPVNTVPGAQSTSEDTAFIFTGATLISIADSDAGSNSVEVTLTATNGTMTLSGTGGLTFTPPGAGNDGTNDATMIFTGTVADINAALNGLTFTPTSNYSGAASVQIQTNDQGNTGGTACSTSQSDTDTVNITVNGANDAPVLDNTGNMALNSIPQDVPAGSNPGTLVSDIILSAGGDRITDADAGAVEGIAVNAVNNTNGVWEFSTNGGGAWTAFGSPSDGIARLLASDANTRVRFLPTLGFSGTVNPGITFRAWDITSGSNGATGDASINGGATAFSTDTETASITVSSTVSIQDATVGEPASPNTANMVFTVTLNAPAAPGGASVQYATADGGATPATGGAACGGSVDYVTKPLTTLTFAAGEQVKSISVTVCSDGTVEPDETFLVNLSSPVNLTIGDGTATGTITAANTAGAILISELRTSGPGGATDEFVEIYNNSNAPHTVDSADNTGYGVFRMGADCNATPILVGIVPEGTVIPARGHYLLTGASYSLNNYGGTNAARGDNDPLPPPPPVPQPIADIPNDANIAIFSTTDVSKLSSLTRYDAVGFGTNVGGNCDLLREGSNLPAVSGSVTEHSFFRKLCDFTTGCTTAGIPKDANNNATDFLFADTQGTLIPGVPRLLGAPGPENLASPIKRDATIAVILLDSTKPAPAVPNRARDLTSNPGNSSTFGTLAVRRRIVNNTGANVTRLRFRIVEMTTFQPTHPSLADLRALTSTLVTVSGVNDPATCFASTGSASTPCSVTVQGTTLEQPPTQTIGGGLNATLAAGTITTGTPLAPGASINVDFLLGIQQTGAFRFLIIVEALP